MAGVCWQRCSSILGSSSRTDPAAVASQFPRPGLRIPRPVDSFARWSSSSRAVVSSPASVPHVVSTRRKSVIAESQPSGDKTGMQPVTTEFKHVLLPIIDRNPYLSESTRQAAATTTALAKKYGADITILVIDQDSQEVRSTQDAKDSHQLQLKTIRWHLSEGGFDDYRLVDRLAEGQKPAALIGELADDLGLDLVIMSMEAIHHKHIDGNILVEFVPCPVLMLPL